MIGLHVDVLVTIGGRAAKEATTTIPIVLLNASDPVAYGYVASLAHPGGNITGLTTFAADLYPKRLQLLKDAAPKIVRVAFVQNAPRSPTLPRIRTRLRACRASSCCAFR